MNETDDVVDVPATEEWRRLVGAASRRSATATCASSSPTIPIAAPG